jgi:hypothetical protein
VIYHNPWSIRKEERYNPMRLRNLKQSFADDTNIQIEATNANILNKKIQEVMQQLSSWLSLNKLVINTEKTITISLHTWQNKSNINLKLYFKIWILNIRMKQNF